MKILFLIEHYAPHVGGVETFFQRLAEGLAGRSHDIQVVTTGLKGSPRRETLHGVAVYRLALPPWGARYWFTFLAPFAVWPFVRQADVVHTTTYNAAWPAWLCATVFRKPLVLTVHEVWGDLWYRLSGLNHFSAFLHGLYERFVLRLPYDRVVAVSDYTKTCLERVVAPSRKVMRIYHGLDPQGSKVPLDRAAVRGRNGIPEHAFVYLSFGRPGWAKGLEYLIDAVPLIQKKRPDAMLVLVLSQDPLVRYRALMRRIKTLGLGIAEHVRVVPSLSRGELVPLLRSADCIVVPSLSEGFGFSAAESCALGLPVAVSSAGSLPEVVWGRVQFFRPADSQDLARAVLSLSEGQWQEIPEKRFAWKDAVSGYEALYHSLHGSP